MSRRSQSEKTDPSSLQFAGERGAFIEMMHNLNLTMPTHLTEALRTNMTGGKTVAQMLAEAAATVPFMSLAELKSCIEAGTDELIVLDGSSPPAVQ